MTLSKTPKIPEGYNWIAVEYHNGITEMPKKMTLHLEPEQEKGYLKGEVIAERLKEKTLNACHLDYLLEHPELIPDEWKGKLVYFWGTIYRDPGDGYLYVRYLYWDGGWESYYRWLGFVWSAYRPAAVSASNLSSRPKHSSDTLPSELKINGIKYIRA